MARNKTCSNPRKGGKGRGKSPIREKMERAQNRARRLGTPPKQLKGERRPTTLTQKRGQKRASKLRAGTPSSSARRQMECRQRAMNVTRGRTMQSNPLGDKTLWRRS